MNNLRLTSDTLTEHADFTIRHAHMSRVSEKLRNQLITISDFCISQIGGLVREVNVDKGSQYFIEDHTDDKRVRSVFENADLTEFQKGIGEGFTSFSRSDLIKLYTI
jgi:hypothetical protein